VRVAIQLFSFSTGPCSALPSIMLLLLECIVFEDCQNQWSLSRPLMCLIMLLPEHFEQVMQVARYVKRQSKSCGQKLILTYCIPC
jgi:hypothetical protein